MKRIAVTIVCSTLIRLGPTNVIYNMLEAYYKTEGFIDYKIVTLSNENPENTRITEFEKLGIPIITCKQKKGLFSLLHLNKIKSIILGTKPDIVLSYGFRADCIVGLINLKGVFKISSLFNNPYDDFQQFGKNKGFMMAKLLLNLYKNFDKIIVCSKFIAEKIEKNNLPIEIIYTGVPTDYFVPSTKERDKNRKLIGIEPTDRIWLFIGNLIPRKNPLFLIDTFNNLKLKNHYLFIMGNGPLMNECVERKNNNKNIILLGARPGTLDYLQIADYYISSSTSEGFPTAVLEAMSVGVTPVLSDIKPHIEMVEMFSKQCIFENNNIKSLSQIISHVEDVVFEKSPRQYLLQNFSSDLMQKKYCDLFLKLKQSV